MERGLVLNIQRYCVSDGPGIRTTVFFKGCPAHCSWCHNPESQAPAPELLLRQARCIRCGACMEACPQGIAGPIAEPSAARADGCTVCGACAEACPTGAVELAGRSMTDAEVLEEILRDLVFFEESGGGATFSGGEPLLQFAFLSALLEDCRAKGVATAVDTCGFASREQFAAIAPLTDLFLYDLKILDPREHLETIGVPNDRILENLHWLGAGVARIWIRIPLIPGITDDPASLEGIAQLAASLPAVERVELLPYHGLGIEKSRSLGRLPAAEPATPSPDRVEELAGIFRAQGLVTGTPEGGVVPGG